MAHRSLCFLFLILGPPSIVLYAAVPAPQKTRHLAGFKVPAVRTPAPVVPTGPPTFKGDVLPVTRQFCGACHGASNPMAGLSLVGFRDTASVIKARDTWEKVAQNVKSRQMPPAGAPQPSQGQRDRLVQWIETTLSGQCTIQDPGRVTLRRLNRAEYNNTIRDLMGVDFHPADDFPSDDVGYGFDNIGDVLSISPLLMEKYLAAAEQVAEKAIVIPDTGMKTIRFGGDQLTGGSSYDNTGGRELATNIEVGTDYNFPDDGDYVLRVQAFGQQAGPDPARMAVSVGGKILRTFDVPVTESAPQVYELHFPAKAGKQHVATAFINDYYNPTAPSPKDRDRNLIVNYIELVTPAKAPAPLPESHRRIITVTPTPTTRTECARTIIGDFARRAYRRPVTPAEVDRLVRYVDLAQKNGESFERGIQLAVEAVLVSPYFLFHVETNAPGANGKSAQLLNNYEMASRLSYFLWSSMPDEELFSLAAKGSLQDPAVVRAQALRMLKDPKAHALAENFAGQWLELRNLAIVSPDPGRFPDFNEVLRTSMRTETEMFFEAIVNEDRSVLDFLDGKFTYLNEPLARHYGIPGVHGPEFRRVALDGTERGGVLTQASILTVTSNPTRTSPVKRGKWVLEQILGTPPPPPPPGIPALSEAKGVVETGSLRERMEQHRKNPACATCHAQMDAIGFGMENYDAVGVWRTKDGTFPIDASGTLTGGHSFNGSAELRSLLMTRKDQFVRCLSEKMLTYALGRGLETYDRCALDGMTHSVAQKQYRFSSLILAVVESDPFRKRREDGAPS